MRISRLRPHVPSRSGFALIGALLVVVYLLASGILPESPSTPGERAQGNQAGQQANLTVASAPANVPARDAVAGAGRKDVAGAPAVTGARREVPSAAPPRAAVRRRSIFNRLLAPGRFAYHEIVRQAAQRYRVEHRLVMAIIASESGGNPDALSPAGAIGLMQLMPETAERLGVDPWDPEQNIDGAVRYLASQLKTFKSVDLSLVAYNAGPGFAEKYRRGHVELGAETRGFLTRVGQLLQ